MALDRPLRLLHNTKLVLLLFCVTSAQSVPRRIKSANGVFKNKRRTVQKIILEGHGSSFGIEPRYWKILGRRNCQTLLEYTRIGSMSGGLASQERGDQCGEGKVNTKKEYSSRHWYFSSPIYL